MPDCNHLRPAEWHGALALPGTGAQRPSLGRTSCRVGCPPEDTLDLALSTRGLEPRPALDDTAVRLVGVYSEHHHGVFTHHGTNMHIHVLTEDGRQSGHLDSLRLAPGGTLLLPAR